MSQRTRFSPWLARWTLCLLLLGTASWAHDIPSKVTLQIYAKPQGHELQVLMRVPVEALREVQFPVRGPGYLELAKAEGASNEAAKMYLTETMHWLLSGKDLGTGTVVRTRLSPPTDRSFVDFDAALAHLQAAPLPAETELLWNQALLDVWVTYPLPKGSGKWVLDAQTQRLAMQTQTVLRFLAPRPNEAPQTIVYDYVGYPGPIEIEPSWWRSVGRFTVMGFWHILDGVDHLLFLFCLIIPVRRLRSLVLIVTAFTLAHSITLLSSALGFTPMAAWFPALVETLIAASILVMAFENIFGARLEHRWQIVFAFGLIHGFGFSFILSDRMQFAGSHLISSLLAFNVGVEIGQLLVLLIAAPLLHVLFKYVREERLAVIALSALAAHSAWHWCTERLDKLVQYPFEWPAFDAAFFAGTLRWAMVLVVSAAVMWGLGELLARRDSLQAEPQRQPE